MGEVASGLLLANVTLSHPVDGQVKAPEVKSVMNGLSCQLKCIPIILTDDREVNGFTVVPSAVPGPATELM